MIIQQESLPYPQLLLQPHPLFPQRHIRQMIQRIQLQELSPKRLVPLPHPQLLLQPHPSLLHPQFVAAKSLMVKPPIFYTLNSMRSSEKCAESFQKLLRKDASRSR